MAARRSANSPNHATGSPPVSNPAGSRNGRQQSALRTRVLAQASATARPHRAQRVQDYTAVRPPFPVRGPQHSHQSLVGVAAPSPTSAVDGAMPISLCCVTKLYGSFVRPAQQTHSGPRTSRSTPKENVHRVAAMGVRVRGATGGRLVGRGVFLHGRLGAGGAAGCRCRQRASGHSAPGAAASACALDANARRGEGQGR